MIKNTESHIDTSISAIKLDSIDKQIVKELIADARLNISELAERVHLSATPCARRVRKLEESGVITGFHAHTDPQKLGYNLTLFVAISMDRHTDDRFSHFEKQVITFDEVVSCSIVTGRTEDYLIKVMVRDMAHYEEFLLHRLNHIEGVSQVHTSFQLKEVFNRAIV